MANKKSRLHIPRPTARPGDKPDFSYLDLSDAGSVDKPSISARTRDIEDLSWLDQIPAGGCVRDIPTWRGEALDYKSVHVGHPHGLLASHGRLHEQIVAMIKDVGLKTL